MTREEILAMEPGRRLDWEIRYTLFGIGSDAFDSDDELWTKDFQLVPKYSTDISAAWEVVEKMHQEGHPLTLDNNHYKGHYDCGFYIDDVTIVQAEALTAPEAICKAALLAVMEA